MAKITYASLKLKKDTSTKTINLEDGKTLEILQYLPFEEKRDLIDIVLQKSAKNQIIKAEGEKLHTCH